MIFFIFLAYTAIKCVVIVSSGQMQCETIPFSEVGAALAVGAEVVLEIRGLITIARRRE